MKQGVKPGGRCKKCAMNLGDRCWAFTRPRDEWKRGRCRGMNDEALLRRFHEWENEPHVKTQKELRQDKFRKRLAKPAVRRTARIRLWQHR
ncbi:MAG: hypothetical protein GX608_05540 [Lentisphaerae bacterium]|nr:hypothetical protein [Lentisphaerota bacterium]